MNKRLAVLVVLLPVSACGGSERGQAGGRDTLTQRQRDSMLAQSKIPGASGVGKAMRVADSVSARIDATDTITP